MNKNRKRSVPGTAMRLNQTMAEPQLRLQEGTPQAEAAEAFDLLPTQLVRNFDLLPSSSSDHKSIVEQNQQFLEPVVPSFVPRQPVRTNGLRKPTQPRFHTHRPNKARVLPNIPRPPYRNGGRGLTPRPRLQPQYFLDRANLLPRLPNDNPEQRRLQQSRPQGNRPGPFAYKSPQPRQFYRPREQKKQLPAPPVLESKAQPTPHMHKGQRKSRELRCLVTNFYNQATPQARPFIGERTRLLPPALAGKPRADKETCRKLKAARSKPSIKVDDPYLKEQKPKQVKPTRTLKNPISLWSINNIEYITYGERIGSGSFSNVFLITRKNDEQRLAAKCSRMTAKSRAYVRREYIILKKITHPNVIKALDFIEFRNVSMIVMEYFSGGTILPLKDGGTKIPENVAQIYVRQCFQVLAYIHSCGVLHNDIKPENILMNIEEFCPHGRTIECEQLKCVETMYNIKLIDFGLAAILPPGKDVIDGVAGTALYMSPETHFLSSMSPKSDVWSMGMTAYQLLAGRLPYERDTSIAPLAQLMEQRATFLNTPELQTLSNSGRHFLQHVLDIDCKKRYTAAEAIDHPWLNPRIITPTVELSSWRILLQKVVSICRLCGGVCRCCTQKIGSIKEHIQIRCRNIARQQILDRRAAEELGLLGLKQPVPRTVVEKYIPYQFSKTQISKPGREPHIHPADSKCSDSPNLEVAAEYLEKRGIILDKSQDQALPVSSNEPVVWLKIGQTGFKPVAGFSTTVHLVGSDKIDEQEWKRVVDQTGYEHQPPSSVESWKFINGTNYEPIAGPSNAPQRWRVTQYTNTSNRRVSQDPLPMTRKAGGVFQKLLEEIEKRASDFETMSSSEFHEWLDVVDDARVELPKWMQLHDNTIDIFKPLGCRGQSGNARRELSSLTKRVQHPQTNKKRLNIRTQGKLPISQMPAYSLRRRMLPTIPVDPSSCRDSWQLARMESIRLRNVSREPPQRPNSVAYPLELSELNLQSNSDNDIRWPPEGYNYSPQ